MTKDLPHLHDLIKPMWSNPCRWRYFDGRIEFALESCLGPVWFPVSIAPKKIENFVKKWIALGNLDEPR